MANPSKVLSQVASIDSKGDGVYSVAFRIPQRYSRYLPGQFLHLALDEFDPTTGFWPESRVFSIASAPFQDHVIIVYSVKGPFTRRMERELSVGKSVWLKLPYGNFIVDENLLARGPLALIAGGTGVSPFIPFLLAERDPSDRVHLFYGVRLAQHLLFHDELKSMHEKGRFEWHLSLEEGSVDGVVFKRGRLSIDQVAETLDDEFSSANFFLSGPPVMIRSFQTALLKRSVTSQQIHIDEWE